MADKPEDRNDQPQEQGESVPLNWACTACGYSVEGEPPQSCPECGADRREFEEIPLPGF